MRKRFRVLCACLIIFGLIAAAACGCSSDGEQQATVEHDTAPQTEAQTEAPRLSSLKINGADISEYRIVYPAAFTREQCYEDMGVAAKRLSDALEALLGIRLPAVPDTEEAVAKEILLGISARAECIRYYNDDTRLDPDEYYVACTNGKLLLGADCLAGVVDACDFLLNYISGEIEKGSTDIDLRNGFAQEGISHVTRIVCVGDSITQGVGAGDEIGESYPAQLQKKLGYEYDVVNYGKGGATMCAYAHELYQTRAYMEKSGYYDDLIAMAPYTDVVVIMLGSNDAMGDPAVTAMLQNDYATFKTDYSIHLSTMVSELKQANPNISVMVFSTTRVYPDGARQKNITSYVRPLQIELAEKLGLAFYDMHTFSATEMTASDFADGLHPTTAGYEKMAQAAANALKNQYGFN